MVPQAHLVSVTPGRTRLRVPARVKDPAYFARLCDALGAYPAVEHVATNPFTGSVLVEHDGPLADLTERAEAEHLFRVVHDLGVLARDGVPARAAAEALDEAEAPELTALAGATLLGLAAFQAMRGKFLPAGLPMVMQAMDLLKSLPR